MYISLLCLYDEENDENYENADDNYPKEISLYTILPEISEYNKYISKECVFKLSLQSEKFILDYYYYEPWWNEFIELGEKAIEKIDENKDSIIQKIEEEQRKKDKTLISQLKELINEKDFTRLPTQVAMKAYAIEKIPELVELSENKLKLEIQKLNGRIVAKGLRRH